MSSIRLKQIEIQSGTLDINNGKLYITDTTNSTSRVTGSIVTLGSIGIANTSVATSSTSGGALTLGGGIAVGKNSIFGGDLNLENVNSTVTISGNGVSRFFIDTESNDNVYIAPNGSNKALDISSTIIQVKCTKISTNSTVGGLVISGGASISSTQNSTSFTNGGGLTVGGGGAFGKDLRVGQDTYVNGNGTTANLFIGANTVRSSVGSVSILSGSTTSLTIDSQKVTIETTTQSLGATSGSLVINGGLGIQKDTFSNGILTVNNTIQSTHTTIGSIVTYGGLGVVKNTVIGGDLRVNSVVGITESVTQSNKLILFQTTGSLTETSNFVGLGVISDSDLAYRIPIQTSNHTFYAGTTEVFRILGTGDVRLKGNSQTYTFSGNGSSSTSISLQSNSVATDSSVEFFTADGDATDTNTLKIFGRGVPTSVTNTEYISLGWDSSVNKYKFRVVKTGTGVLQDLSLESGITNQILLRTSGTVSVSGALDIISLSATDIISTSNTLTNSINTLGGFTLAKTLTIAGGVNLNNRLSATTVSNLELTSNTGNVGLVLQSAVPVLSMMSVGTIGSTNTESFAITSSTSGVTIRNVQTGSGVNRSIDIGTSNQIHLNTNGNVCIGTTTSDFKLNVNGSFNATSVNSNTVQINSTVNSTGPTIGSIFTLGGAGIAKDLSVGGIISVNSTEANSFNTLGGISVSKGLNVTQGITAGSCLFTSITVGSISVIGTVQSTSTSTGSALISGGVGIVKNAYIGGDVNASGNVVLNGSTVILQGSNVTRNSIERDASVFSISRYDSSGGFLDKSLSISNTTGEVTITNTCTIQKALTINSTIESTGPTVGGVVLYGGLGLSKDLNIGKNCTIYSTTESIDTLTGSLIVKGGIGLSKNLNVGGNVVVTGTLVVNGTTTTVNSTTTNLVDNILVLNSGPAGSRDAGIIFTRFQADNDAGLGDVVTDTTFVTDTIPDQSAMTSTQITLSTSANNTNDYYTGWYIKVTSGFSASQVRKITAYIGSSRLATVAAWTSQNPSLNDTVNIYNKSFVGLFYNEFSDIFQLSATVQDPGFASVNSTAYVGLQLDTISVLGTRGSTGSSTGSLVTVGGIGVRCTTNSVSVTNGGALSIAGGASIQKDLIIGGSLTVNGVAITTGISSVSFTGANNQTSAVDITSALIPSTAYGAEIYISTRVLATTNVYSNYHLRVVNQQTSWDLTESYIGGDSGINFSITSGGQIQYTSPDFPGFTSLTMKFMIISN